MAGVPPFIGFFSKLFILILLINNSFFIFYFLFFIVLFIGLYFYIQNIRFIHSTNLKIINKPYIFNIRNSLYFNYVIINFIIFIIFGLYLIDDVVLFFSWIFK